MTASEEKKDRSTLLREVRDEVFNLKNSPLYSYRTSNRYYPVLGEGSHYAKVMFIGEAPGKNEALQGRPFCGAAGKILDELLAEAGLKRAEVYITNIVKDRPPENRDPTPDEITAYAPFLERQIEIIKPQVIATLGRYSMAYIMEKFGLGHELRPISQIHGHVFETDMSYGKVKIVPLYHPAAAIYNRTTMGSLKEDFEALKSIVQKVDQ